jgi:hypothetical protein
VAYSRVEQTANGEQCNIINEIFCIPPTTTFYISPIRNEIDWEREDFACPAASS